MAINVAPWIKETCITTGTGALVLSVAPVSYAKFNDAIGAGEEVYYAILDDNGNRESGLGTFDGTATITRTRVTAALVGTVYNDTNPTAINLSGSSTVICTFNEAAYDDLLALIALAAKPDRQIIITEASQLAGVLDSTVEYLIDGVIDMGATPINMPVGGINIRGLGADVSKLLSAANTYTMFTGTIAGNISVSRCSIELTGTGSQVYNVTGAAATTALILDEVNYVSCTSLGSLTTFRQIIETTVRRLDGTPELELIGIWGNGGFFELGLVRNLIAGSYFLFKAGTGLTFNSRFRANISIDLPAGVGITDFSAANFPIASTFQLQGAIVTREGLAAINDALYLPNISPSELACEFRNNQGLPNTFEGLIAKITTEVITPVAVASTFYDVSGTFTVSNLEHFTMPVNGQFRHDGNSPQEYSTFVFATVAGTANDIITLKLVRYNSMTLAFEDVDSQTRVINNSQSGTDLVYYTFGSNATIDKNDYLKLQVANTSGARDVTLRNSSELIIKAR